MLRSFLQVRACARESSLSLSAPTSFSTPSPVPLRPSRIVTLLLTRFKSPKQRSRSSSVPLPDICATCNRAQLFSSHGAHILDNGNDIDVPQCMHMLDRRRRISIFLGIIPVTNATDVGIHLPQHEPTIHISDKLAQIVKTLFNRTRKMIFVIFNVFRNLQASSLHYSMPPFSSLMEITFMPSLVYAFFPVYSSAC
jgi:hypothetical protein